MIADLNAALNVVLIVAPMVVLNSQLRLTEMPTIIENSLKRKLEEKEKE